MNERISDPSLEAAVRSLIDMLRKQYGDDRAVWQEILSTMRRAEEAASEAVHFDVLSLCLSCEDVMGHGRPIQKAPLKLKLQVQHFKIPQLWISVFYFGLIFS